MKIISTSSRMTQGLAKLLAQEVLKDKPKSKNALVFALSGDLGAGKTTFIQGFAKGLGIKNRITSPTFLIFRNYKIPNYRLPVTNYQHFYHVDVYRIKTTKELNVLGLKHDIENPKNIIVIEWAEKIRKILPKNTIWIKFAHGKEENERLIEFQK